MFGGPGRGAPLASGDAQRVRDACLRSLKERLLERSNIIQYRLDDKNARLSKKQATFQRNAAHDGGDPAEKAEFEKFAHESPRVQSAVDICAMACCLLL